MSEFFKAAVEYMSEGLDSYAALRAAAEQAIKYGEWGVDPDPQTILALLDERDQLDRSLDDRALLEGRAEAAERRVASLTDALASAEARVSGLEEGLRFIQGDGCLASIWASDDPLVWEQCLDEDYREEPLTGNPHADRCEACEARALLNESESDAAVTVGLPAPFKRGET